MSRQIGKCFIIMPFSRKMYNFYLFVKDYVQNTHNLSTDRADSERISGAFLDKIIRMIDEADVIICDCTYHRPNVLYELGIAHSKKQENVILILDKEEVGDGEKLPSDIKHFDCIEYNKTEHMNFLSELDSSIKRILKLRYRSEYDTTLDIFDDFLDKNSLTGEPIPFNDFGEVLLQKERSEQIPMKESIPYRKLLLKTMAQEIREPEIDRIVAEYYNS